MSHDASLEQVLEQGTLHVQWGARDSLVWSKANIFPWQVVVGRVVREKVSLPSSPGKSDWGEIGRSSGTKVTSRELSEVEGREESAESVRVLQDTGGVVVIEGGWDITSSVN